MPPKRAVRFGDNTAAARKLKELFTSGTIDSSTKPSAVRAAYPNEFGNISAKAFGDKFRKFANDLEASKFYIFFLR